MPDKRPSVKNEKQYEALKEKGMSKERAARSRTRRERRVGAARPPVQEETLARAERPHRRRRPEGRAERRPPASTRASCQKASARRGALPL